MKRKCKIIFCVMTITLVVCSFALPCLADNWADISPKAVYSFKTPNLPNGIDTANDLFEAVEKAFQLGLFGGDYPVAITAYYSSYYQQTGIYIYTSGINQTTPPMQDKPIKETVHGYVNGSSLNYNQLMPDGTTSVTTMKRWTLLENGSVSPSATFYASSTNLSTTSSSGEQIIGTWSRITQSWQTYETSQYSYITDDYNTVTTTFDNILSNYERALSNNSNENNVTVNYILDIPGIITAIPNGAKQMINNAFGFEIFGINVAGLLSVILIVTIVAFVVKWLMSR